MWSCAVICTAGGFLLLEDEIQEGAEQFTWRDSEEESFNCATPMCGHMCVIFLYCAILCAIAVNIVYTGPDRLCRIRSISSIHGHGCLSVPSLYPQSYAIEIYTAA